LCACGDGREQGERGGEQAFAARVTLGHEHAVEAVTLGLLGLAQELRGKLRGAFRPGLRLLVSAAVGVRHVTDGDHRSLLVRLLFYTFVRQRRQWVSTKLQSMR